MKLQKLVLFSLFVGQSLFAQDTQSEPVRIYADIVGDLFHAGHIQFFKKAKEFGDYLIVGVLADDIVESYKRVPVLTLEERVEAIRACRYVDEVIVAPPLRTTPEWLKEKNIRYVVHGDDYSQELLRDHYGESIDAGVFKMVPYTQGISSTGIIKRIVERYKNGEFQY